MLKDTPSSISELRTELPARLARIVHRCLVKNPRRRYQSTRDLASDLEELREELKEAGSISQLDGGTSAAPTRKPLPIWLTIAIIVVAIGTGALGYHLATEDEKPPPHQEQPEPKSAQPEARFAVKLPNELMLETLHSQIALSPDGKHLVFSALRGATIGLYIRDLDALEIRELKGAKGGKAPFFSPNGKWVGFFVEEQIKKVPISGGKALTISDSPHWSHFASWGANGQIVIAGQSSGLWSVPASGGKLVQLTTPDASKEEKAHTVPRFLPDGRLLFLVHRENDSTLAVFDPSEGTRRDLDQQIQGVFWYMPSGYLVFIQTDSLV
ncbi:MAG: PD40 domain-containing protein, partial [Deltaproteobacteria bacterium]|nr:PD40 domain-containing protein [Deltaproteobacteria bacterium]